MKETKPIEWFRKTGLKYYHLHRRATTWGDGKKTLCGKTRYTKTFLDGMIQSTNYYQILRRSYAISVRRLRS